MEPANGISATPADALLAIGDGPIRLELLPAVGARLHRLEVFGHDLLRTPDDPVAGVCLVVATRSSLGAVAIEPQTHAPQGLRRFLAGEPGGLHPIAAGATMDLITELSFERRRGVQAASSA